MNQDAFNRALDHAQLMDNREDIASAYWNGFERGIKRALHGETFCSQDSHQTWLSAAESRDPMTAEAGRGYRDGLSAA
ncbi:MAG: hypothetical protein ABFS23_12525 [Pseudomonadota bacterium]